MEGDISLSVLSVTVTPAVMFLDRKQENGNDKNMLQLYEQRALMLDLSGEGGSF